MKFIIQKFKGDDSWQDLAEKAKSRCHSVLEVGVEANLEILKDVIDFDKGDLICFFGSIKMVELYSPVLKNPFIVQKTQNYKCSNYYPQVQKYLFNDKHAFFTVGSLQDLKFDIYRWFGKDTCIFMRPDSGEKLFTGGIFDLQYFDKDYENWIEQGCEQNDLVLISTPKNITGEYRIVCDDKKNIITYSTYQFQGNKTIIPSVPKGALKKCEEVLTELKPPDKIFTVDICEDSDGNYWLLEINSFFSAGLYACNLDKILDWLENNND